VCVSLVDLAASRFSERTLLEASPAVLVASPVGHQEADQPILWPVSTPHGRRCGTGSRVLGLDGDEVTGGGDGSHEGIQLVVVDLVGAVRVGK